MSKYIVALDQSTSATKAFLLDADLNIMRSASSPLSISYPGPGMAEQDGEEIWQSTVNVIREVTDGVNTPDIAAIGISSQRESVVFWDTDTGKPIRPVIGWQDTRGSSLCDELSDQADEIRARTGLALSPYYSAAKIASAIRSDVRLILGGRNDKLRIGTVNSYMIYRLTGGSFRTDVSNACRTQLYNLATLDFDPQLCAAFGLPYNSVAAQLLLCDGDFGITFCPELPSGIPIRSSLGDSHASFFAHGCAEPGIAKATYGTGSSVMMNIGTVPVMPKNGLSLSIGYGTQTDLNFVFEGNITSSGDTLRWLRDEIELFHDADEIEKLAGTVDDSGGVVLIPAFSGLGAPYFDTGARAVLCGMNRGTTRAHIARAALESIAFQITEVINMMRESGCDIKELRADGGGSRDPLLMQMQADLSGCRVCAADSSELSGLGAGFMAGIAAGVYDGKQQYPSLNHSKTYIPQKDNAWRAARMEEWQKAIARARL